MKRVKITTEVFITKAKEVHGDKYDYSNVEYVNTNVKVCIICPEHGEFCQSPHGHLSGRGCPKCGANKRYKSRTSTTEIFIEKARKIIVDNSSDEIFLYAFRLLLSLYVNQINQNYANKNEEVRKLNKECRDILKKERKNLHYLIKRQQIAAYLIIYAPWLHRIIYKLYDSRRKK